MKKKVLTLLMVAALAAGMIVGCQKKAPEEAKDTSKTEKTTAEDKDTEDASPSTDNAEDNATSTEDDYIPSWDGMDPGYDYNTDYDKFALTEYHWKETDEDVIVVVSAMDDNSKFECHFTMGGEEQLAVVSYDGNTYTVESDKTGDASKEVTEICKSVVDAGEWVEIADIDSTE